MTPPAIEHEVGYIGIDTVRKTWFYSPMDGKNQNIGVIPALSVTVEHGTTHTYGWMDNNPDAQPTPFWHIRSAIVGSRLRGLRYDGRELVLDCEPVIGAASGVVPLEEGIAAVHWAYSRRTGLGFVEMVDKAGAVISTLRNRWIATENLTQRTFGIFPDARLRAEREEVAGLVITPTTCVLRGVE